ncbi:MAG: hypothetical protein RL385_4323, partial [Pseudomonadota bacterium]
MGLTSLAGVVSRSQLQHVGAVATFERVACVPRELDEKARGVRDDAEARAAVEARIVLAEIHSD